MGWKIATPVSIQHRRRRLARGASPVVPTDRARGPAALHPVEEQLVALEVRLVQAGARVPQVDRDPLGQARGQPQDPLFATGRRWLPGLGRADRCGPVDGHEAGACRCPRIDADEAVDVVAAAQPATAGDYVDGFIRIYPG